MTLTLQTAATVAAISVAEVKSHLRIDVPDDDALVEMYRDAAQAYAFGLQGYTGRSLVNETFDETFDRWSYRHGRYALVLGRATVRSVTSVTYLDTNGTSQTLAADQYQLVTGDPGVIVSAYNVTWPTLRDVPDAVTVRFVAGFGAAAASVPQDIRLAIAQLAAHWYENREAVVIGAAVNGLPDMYQRIFDKYRVWGL